MEQAEPAIRVEPTEPLQLLYRDLRSSARGLSEREAARRLSVYGPNELRRSRRRSPWRDLSDQLVHPLALLLWVAALLAWLVGTPVLAVAIVLVILLNAAFAFLQERHGERAVEALADYLPQRAVVRRDGRRLDLLARDLVPGDIVMLAEGDRVCADARLVEGSLEVDMSALNGESVPALRSAEAQDTGEPLLQAPTLVFSGSSCTGGEAVGLVVNTGMHTELGRIASLTQAVSHDQSPLEIQVRRVARLIAFVAVCAAAAFIPVGVILAGLSWPDSITFAIGLIVANVPEGLLPTITLALAVAVRELARRGALVKRLSAVETLGATSVICTDKTGTLTENRMHAVLLWSPEGEAQVGQSGVADARRWTRAAEVLASCTSTHQVSAAEAAGQTVIGDPTEIALLEVARRVLPDPASGASRLALFHFDPARRLMTTVDRMAEGVVVHTKGAPEAVLARSTRAVDGYGATVALDGAQRRLWLEATERYAGRGLRLIAVAHRDLPSSIVLPADRDSIERDLVLDALVALLDPPRAEVAAAIQRCHNAGVRVVVITGDHPLTAQAIARQVGIGDASPASLDGRELEDVTDDQLDEVLDGARELVIARATAELKMRVTESLQAAHHVVAVTGDGVNDAPALRRADIGVAMGMAGTDVAREAGAMVITDDNFRTITDAVEGGRRVYDNVRRFVLYIFAHATPEIVPFLVFALSGGRVPLPLTVLQILAIDIGTETLPALALGREPAEPGIMERPPRPPAEPLIGPGLLARAWGLLGGVSAVLVTAGFFLVLVWGGWTPGAEVGPGAALHSVYLQATTMTFLGIVACQVGTAFAVRTDHVSILRVGLLSNRLLVWGIAFELAFAAAVVGLPGINSALGMAAPPADALLLLCSFPVIVLAADEAMKLWQRHRFSAPPAVRRSSGGDAAGPSA